MSHLQVAIYARVSGEHQTEAHTIQSQLAALRERIAAAGEPRLADLIFIDEGYSGATLVRPALERLRDIAASGGIDQLYVHSPDRLARKYAYQVLLLEELERSGVEVVFRNHPPGASPEEALLMQVQGMVAEYERAKILERSRRGKRHAARVGAVNVLAGAPYGYRYVSKHEGGGQARFEILLEEARVVRQVFRWVGQERATIGEVCRRLTQAGERTRTGKTVWDRATVRDMLKNPAYQGEAAFGKTRSEPLHPRLRAQRGRPLHPRRTCSVTDQPPEDWLLVPVPALVEPDVFAAVQEQLQENQRHARTRHRGARYLLQGLLVCARCGYAYYGKAVRQKTDKGQPRDYAYYRCLGTDAYRFGGERICTNHQVRTDLLDAAVWQEVCALLEAPGRLEEEYRRRLQPPPLQQAAASLTSLEAQLAKRRQGVARLIDSYVEGLIEKSEFEPRLARLRQRLAELEEQVQQCADATGEAEEVRLLVGRLEMFAAKVQQGLAEADWQTRRGLIRTLVKRVEVEQEDIRVVFRVAPDPFVLGPEQDILPHWGRGDFAAPGKRGPSRIGNRARQGLRPPKGSMPPGRPLRRRFCHPLPNPGSSQKRTGKDGSVAWANRARNQDGENQNNSLTGSI